MQTPKGCRIRHWIPECLLNACCNQNIPINDITSPDVLNWLPINSISSKFFCVFSFSIANIGFLNVMAKCHPVNESAYNTDTGPWITIKSLHVVWLREAIFSFNFFKWFSDLVENTDWGKMSDFSDIWQRNCASGIAAVYPQMTLRCCGLLQGYRGTNWVMMGIIAAILHNIGRNPELRDGPWGVDI